MTLTFFAKAVVFKTSAINHSAIPPFNQINDLIDMGDDHIPVVYVQRNRAAGNGLIQVQSTLSTNTGRKTLDEVVLTRCNGCGRGARRDR